MRRCSYTLNHEQIAKIQRYVVDSFRREAAREVLDREAQLPHQNLKSLKPTFRRGSLNLTSKDSSSKHGSDDLSLLGPGKTVESAAPFAFVSDPPLEKSGSLNHSASHGYDGGPIITSELSKKRVTNLSNGSFNPPCQSEAKYLPQFHGQYRAPTHLGDGKPQLRTASVGRARMRLKSSHKHSTTLKPQGSLLASGVGTDHRSTNVPELAASTQRENCKGHSKGGSQLRRQAPINIPNGQKEKAGASPLLRITSSNSAKPAKPAEPAKPTLSSDSEDLANVEDDGIFLASWMSEGPDKIDKKMTLMSNDVSGPQSLMSSSGLMNGVSNKSNRVPHHASPSPSMGFDNGNSKRVSKKNISLVISASVTRHSDNIESFNGCQIESSHPSCRPSPQSLCGLDFNGKTQDTSMSNLITDFLPRSF